MTPLLKLPFSFDAAALQVDLQAFSDAEWTPHFNVHNYQGDWSGIALRTTRGAHVALYPDPTATAFEDTEMMARCFYVPQLLTEFHCDLETVRFLRLGAGAAILEHRDHKLAMEDGVARIHIPVKTSSQVEFVLDGQRVEMKEGEAWYLNFNLRHSVKNNSDEDRVHLVVDCVVNDWLRGFFPTAVTAAN
jgi:hypothetical protein